MREVKVAAVAPVAFRGELEYRNVAQAAAYIEESVRHGAQLVVFPEGYPGPCNGPMDSGGNLAMTPIAMMQEVARNLGVYISCGNMEETGILPDTYYLCHKLISPTGEILANYKRCQPTPPAVNAYLYNGRRHVLPGNEPRVVDTEIGRLGLIICSELKVPELARVEMLMGAEVLLDPVGGTYGRAILREDSHGTLVPRVHMNIWKALAQARAAENIMYVMVTANIWEKESTWGSCIASPEGLIAESEGTGIIYGILDMERLRYLRSRSWQDKDFQDAPATNTPITDPAQHRDRRPELYQKLVEPQPDAFNFFYYKNGLETWKEFDRSPLVRG
jgi:predicted amidohydrolase